MDIIVFYWYQKLHLYFTVERFIEIQEQYKRLGNSEVLLLQTREYSCDSGKSEQVERNYNTPWRIESMAVTKIGQETPKEPVESGAHMDDDN